MSVGVRVIVSAERSSHEGEVMSELPDDYFEKKEALLKRIRDGRSAEAELSILEHQYQEVFSLERP